MGPGQRNDIIDFRDRIREGDSKKTLWESHPVQMAKYRHMYGDYNLTNKPIRTYDLRVVLLVGKTGTGKTRTVHEMWKSYWTMPISNGTMWFDGYDLDDNVLIDDFNGARSKVALDTYLRITDRYPIMVPIKGGFAWWMPRSIVVTSNFHPASWYDYKKRMESYHALCRRIHDVFVFDEGQMDRVEDLPAYWKKGMDSAESLYCTHDRCKFYEECQIKD